MTSSELAAAFFVQMAVVLAASRAVGTLAARVGQPRVVGEMIAGVLVGPSCLGVLAPSVERALFPRETLGTLHVGAQLGIGLYMLFVGVEFRSERFAARARTAASVSLAGMLVPMALGAALAARLFDRADTFGPGVATWQAMLFLGAAMSITALPVLARILDEHGALDSHVGTLALGAASIGDVVAWCVLAVVLAASGGGPSVAARAVGGGLAYAVVVLTLGRRGLARLGAHVEREGALSPSVTTGMLALAMAVFWLTDAIGIHAVFGGFLLGVAMPEGSFAVQLRAKLEPFVVAFLVPMFFVVSGLATRFDTLSVGADLGVGAAVLLVACLGKGVACFGAARLSGEGTRASLAIGALMNARGLTELILLNIGLARGILLPGLFSLMVLMAVVTTLLATPLFVRFRPQA